MSRIAEPSASSMYIAEYSSPALTATCFWGLRLLSSFRLKKAPIGHNSQGRRRFLFVIIGAVAATYLASAVSVVLRPDPSRSSESTSHAVVGFVASALIWIAILRQLRAEKRIRWDHLAYCVACSIATQPTFLRLTTVNEDASLFMTILFGTSLSALTICLLFALRNHRTPAPAISSKSVAITATEKESASIAEDDISLSDYAADESDEDGDSDDDDDPRAKEKKEMEAKQKARLEQSGDWLTFLAAYKVFLPLIFPFGNRKLQAGIFYLIFHLAFTQVISFLVPHQMGVIADKLVSVENLKTEFPLRQVVFWGVLQLFESELCYTVREMIFLPIHNYVYKSICSTAFRHVMNLSMDFHHDKSSSDVIRTVHQGENLTQIVSFICFDLSPLAADVFIALTYVTATFEPYLMLIMLAGGIINCWLATDSNKWARKQRKKYNKAQREMSKSQYEALSNWQTVSQFNHNKYESDRYAQFLEDYCREDGKITMVYNIIGTVRGCFMLTARLLATALIMLRVSQGKVPLGQLVTFTAVWDKVMDPVSQLSRLSRRIQMLVTDSERLLVLLQTKPSVQDKLDAKPFELKAGEVEFDHVAFAYDKRKPTLTDVDVKVPAGSTVALVGETGGGKTTMIRMLYRYYDVTGGAIRIDGQDLRDVTLDSLRNSFGFVPQDPALFNTSLLENLRYARLDATDEEIMEACRAACIHDKIMQFPDKYKSKVGERGVKLSGGEMQRVAVARAILRNPKIVLLDEATSMIDAETEHLIQKALRSLTAGRTTFVVAHRLSTIQHADLILVIEDGKIIERGNHEELFRQGGKYVKLWSKQMSKHVNVLPDPPANGADTPPHSDGEMLE